jgi:hypothetical protein
MHTATYPDRAALTAQRHGRSVTLDTVFPAWQSDDRFGIVVDRPYGLVGASLLVQVAALLFYEVAPERSSRLKRYPELYAFLIDGPKGDLGMFDFYPARKEVIVPRDPAAILDSVHDRAITRLAVIDGQRSDYRYGWDERNTALDRIATAYAYSPSGQAYKADLILRGTERTELNVSMTLEPNRLIDMITNWSEDDIREFEPQLLDDDVAFDAEAYAVYARARALEVPEAERRRLVRERAALLQDGVPVECYRTVNVDEALELLVPLRSDAGP